MNFFSSQKLLKNGKAHSFKINFRGQISKVDINHDETTSVDGTEELTLVVNNNTVVVSPYNEVNINNPLAVIKKNKPHRNIERVEYLVHTYHCFL
jgi:hypothetical protein